MLISICLSSGAERSEREKKKNKIETHSSVELLLSFIYYYFIVRLFN